MSLMIRIKFIPIIVLCFFGSILAAETLSYRPALPEVFLIVEDTDITEIKNQTATMNLWWNSFSIMNDTPDAYPLCSSTLTLSNTRVDIIAAFEE